VFFYETILFLIIDYEAKRFMYNYYAIVYTLNAMHVAKSVSPTIAPLELRFHAGEDYDSVLR